MGGSVRLATVALSGHPAAPSTPLDAQSVSGNPIIPPDVAKIDAVLVGGEIGVL